MSISIQSFQKSVKNKMQGAKETVSNYSTVAKNYIKQNTPIVGQKEKLTSKMTENTKLTPGIMGNKNFDTAYNKVKKLVSSGKYEDARNYVKSQDEKIRQQGKFK